jgi:hypothetical protein
MINSLVRQEINPALYAIVCLFVFRCLNQVGANQPDLQMQRVERNFADTYSKYRKIKTENFKNTSEK